MKSTVILLIKSFRQYQLQASWLLLMLCWGSLITLITIVLFCCCCSCHLFSFSFKRVVKKCFSFCLCIPVKLFLMKLPAVLWNCLLLAFCDSQFSLCSLDLLNVTPTFYFYFSVVFSLSFANVLVTNYQHKVKFLVLLKLTAPSRHYQTCIIHRIIILPNLLPLWL